MHSLLKTESCFYSVKFLKKIFFLSYDKGKIMIKQEITEKIMKNTLSTNLSKSILIKNLSNQMHLKSIPEDSTFETAFVLFVRHLQ